MTLTYTSNYTEITGLNISQICEIIDNSTYNCIGQINGQINVIPYNQDLLIVLLTIISVCVLILVIFKLWETIA